MDELISRWDEILDRLIEEYEIGTVSFNTWIKPLEVFAIEGDVLYLMFSAETNKMSLEYTSKKYKDFIKVTIAEITGKEYDIRFILPKDAAALKLSNKKIDENIYNQSNINSKYTFDTFVVGNNNRFAQNAALAVAESPGESYNPLYIYGGPGLGKTHLLHAIGNFILQENSNKKVLYVTSEEFTNEVIESIRNNSNVSSMAKLRDKYRTVDILMIDDIQFIIGKDATQEEFFHTFNALDQAGKQIIISSDKPPKDMETLETRIRSRFEMGLMADIGYPDYETRMAILRKKMESEKKVEIPDDVLNYIAENIKSNVREIEGALNKILAYVKLDDKKELTVEVAKEELQSIISPDKPREITPQLIIEVVAEHYNLTMEQMISKKRTNNISNPRQIAMYLCKTMTEYPLDAIGQLLGGRDHSTIIHGANKIENDYINDEETKNQIEAIKKKINPNL